MKREMVTKAPEAKVGDLVAKETELTKLLASNDPRTRSDGIKRIKQLLLKHSEDTSDAFQLIDYLVIWRELFYLMETSDKPVPQESVIEKISYLIHSCTSYQGKILFLDAFFLTIKDDWMSIRQHYNDKCKMLVRHCLRQLLFTFVNCDWNLEYMNKFSEILYRALKLSNFSLRTHLQVIFLEELAKVSRGKVPSEALVIILDSFLHYISELNNFMLIREVTNNVFRNLLSQSPDLRMFEAKIQDLQKVVNPDNSYNDLEMVGGDVVNDNSNRINNNPFDIQAGNDSDEIPPIKFNPKEVAKVLNKYLTEVDCTRKCSLEITKLIQFYNRLGDCILPNKQNDLKLNSQILNQKKKQNLSEMVKKGVKKLEIVDSGIKKSCLEVYDHKSFKNLKKIGEIVVEHGQMTNPKWEVRNVDNVNTLKENFYLNGSWTILKETKINSTNTVCSNDDKPPFLVPVRFSVDVLETPEKTPTKIQEKIPLTQNFKSLTDNSSLKERNSNECKNKSQISKINNGLNKKHKKKQNSRFIKIGGPNALNASYNNSWLISTDDEESVSNMVKNSTASAKVVQLANASPFNSKSLTSDNKIEGKNQVNNEPSHLALVPAVFDVDVSKTPEKTIIKLLKKVSSLTPNFKSSTVNSFLKEPNMMNEIAVEREKIGKSMWEVRKFDNVNTLKDNFYLNSSWTISDETKIDSTNTVCINDGEPTLNVPAGFNVEVSGTPENTVTKLQKKVSSTSNLKSSTVDLSLKDLNKMGEIVVKRGKIGNFKWKVTNVDNVNTIKDNLNLNGLWTISKETKINGTNTVCNSNDNKLPFLVTVGFNVKVSKTPEKTIIKFQKKVSLTPNFKSSTVDSSLKERNMMSEIAVEREKIGKSMWEVRKFDNVNTLKDNFYLNSSWTISDETKIDSTNTVCINDGEPTLNVPAGFNVEVSGTPENTVTKLQKKVSSTSNFKSSTVDLSPKDLNKMGKIVAKREKIGNFKWKVTNVDNVNTIKDNLNLNGLWTISKKTKINGTNTVCNSNDDKPPFLVPVRFSVDVLETPEKTPTKIQKKVSLTPNFKSLTVDSSLKEKYSKKHKSKSLISKMNNGSNKKNLKQKNSRFIKIGTPYALNSSNNNSWSISADHGGPESKKIKNSIESAKTVSSANASHLNNKSRTPDNKIEEINQVDDEPLLHLALADARFNVEVSETPKKIQSQNDSWSICNDEKLKSSNCKSPVSNTADQPNKKSNQKSNSPFHRICSPSIVNTSENTSATKLLQECRNTISGNKLGKVEKGSLLTSVITLDKSSESSKSPTFEQRVLRRRTTIIPTKPDGQNEGILKRKLKKTSATKVLQERRKTIAGTKLCEVEKGILPTSVITPDKSLESSKSPTFEQRVLRQRTIIIPMKLDGQNKDTLKRKLRETSATEVLQKRRKTIEREEISMFKSEEISNKALENVQSGASENSFGSLRKSPRLLIKADSAKKRVEYQC